MRKCNKCNIKKPLECFVKQNGYYLHKCRECYNESYKPKYMLNSGDNTKYFCKHCGIKFNSKIKNTPESTEKEGYCVECVKKLVNSRVSVL